MAVFFNRKKENCNERVDSFLVVGLNCTLGAVIPECRNNRENWLMVYSSCVKKRTLVRRHSSFPTCTTEPCCGCAEQARRGSGEHGLCFSTAQS